MVTTGQPEPESFTWTFLPAEIRTMILNVIARQKHPGWASLASVCREWQSVLEPANFDKLKLRVSCLDDFSSVVSPSRTSIIHHICLNIELPRYACDDCCRRLSMYDNTSSIVSNGIWRLFSILSAWKPAGDLALELNVYSPSDRDHWFKGIYLSTDDVEEDEDSVTSLNDWRGEPWCHDPRHGWLHGRQIMDPPRSAILRLFQPITLRFQKPLPRVRAVTRFLMRRQLRRYLFPMEIRLLLNSLVHLDHMVYEPWAPAFAILVKAGLPGSLRSLTIFEDFFELYNRFSRRLSDGASTDLFPDGLRLGATFASRSRNLRHLSISFMINAEEFFRYCQPAGNWPHLQSLALTANFLGQDESLRPCINVLLCRAGVLAQRMPKLHTFVLWNGARGHACAFIYRVEQDGPSITWRGTWRLPLSEDPYVIRVWRLVASGLRFHKLRIKQQRIFRDITSRGDAVYRLKLPCQVVEPASLWQMRREGYKPYY
ncbi:hypothetical protein M419DRAFT_75104 [Trichoderma reesei RUT C-30]|uniref:DUF6546 domain-containing protein n=1 Tax=Hypocrea jecorina (strain ATCC 56765 / BCRC 32924 / NRRL 11460 / Rut C-30) TaxID=1344414 RepID=A0A024SEC2_HYPJR|nr:hypothetical protein M419DRAFT_75104 [Trichoderma reesei RUT C-30]